LKRERHHSGGVFSLAPKAFKEKFSTSAEKHHIRFPVSARTFKAGIHTAD
jgi:hypothetical protein